MKGESCSSTTGGMYSAILINPRQFLVQATEPPLPTARQVRIQIEGCGVCGSNLPVWEGRSWFEYPLAAGAPGHEGWGTVDLVGEEVTEVQPGQRVGCLSYHAFSSYDLADASQVVVLPAQLAQQPFPAEPLACGMNVFKRSCLAAGQSVAVIGIGFLGAILVQLAARAGCKVTAASRRPFALEMAERCGATDLVELENGQAPDNQFNDRFHCVIEATGQQSALDLATQWVAYGGRIVIAGYHQDGLRQVNMQQWNWKGIDVINAHERDPLMYVDGMRAAVDAVAAGDLVLEELITHEFPLSRIDAAFQTATQRPHGFLKAYVSA